MFLWGILTLIYFNYLKKKKIIITAMSICAVQIPPALDTNGMESHRPRRPPPTQLLAAEVTNQQL